MQDNILRVNWLIERNLFDFQAVEIVQASDEDIEQFANQVSNDTNSTRQPYYRRMRCYIASGCNISENTLKILRQQFGLVEQLTRHKPLPG